MNPHLAHYLESLENLEARKLDDLLALCDSRIHFRDPFNDCRGVDAYGRILRDMFEKLDELEFRVNHYATTDTAGLQALAQWSLRARLVALGNQAWSVEGCSEIRFDERGKVTAHYDYWDAAAGLYEQLPVLGRLLRLVRKRLRVD